jgi:hypothetical protein
VQARDRQKKSAPDLNMIQMERALDQVQMESFLDELLHIEEIAQLDVQWTESAVSPERWSWYSVKTRID